MKTIASRLGLLAANLTFVAGSAFAQAPSPRPSAEATGETAPAEATAPGQNLSERLDQSNGVIRPKEVDPAIEKPAPNPRDPNVVPPPGTSGGAPAPQPK